MQHKQQKLPKKILRMRQVCEKTGMSRAWIYGAIKSGNFPISRKLSRRAIGWEEQEIDDWITSRIYQEVKNG
jgi:prophage regulatory protein